MAHLLTPATTTAATALSTRARTNPLSSRRNCNFPCPRVVNCVGQQYQHKASSISDHDQVPPPREELSLCRRTLVVSGAIVLGLSLNDEQSANAAGRPPPPPREKKDPNVSGVQAKVLASKKRKEALKESVAKLRKQGKAIVRETQEPPPAPE